MSTNEACQKYETTVERTGDRRLFTLSSWDSLFRRPSKCDIFSSGLKFAGGGDAHRITVGMKNILTIAGYDPSSGAGITRDLDIFFSLGLHGLSAPTCTVIQGPMGVMSVRPTPIKTFEEILEGIERDIPVHGVKIGVLCNTSHIKATAAFLKRRGNIPVVIDPVFAAKNGAMLLADNAVATLIKELFPVASIITPNIDEAARMCGMVVKNRGHMEKTARLLLKKGPRAVVIKGGHLKGNPEDIFFDGTVFCTWERKRINRQIHGTGCTFSSLLTAFLVLGNRADDAFFAAEDAMEKQLSSSYRIGPKGYCYLSSAAGVGQKHSTK
jgi:hydroxymethylpyrimidine kinase/phosphomethylpyrimidine kinase